MNHLHDQNDKTSHTRLASVMLVWKFMPVEKGNIFNKTYLSLTVHTVYHITH